MPVIRKVCYTAGNGNAQIKTAWDEKQQKNQAGRHAESAAVQPCLAVPVRGGAFCKPAVADRINIFIRNIQAYNKKGQAFCLHCGNIQHDIPI